MNNVIKILLVDQEPGSLAGLPAALKKLGFSLADKPIGLEEARLAILRDHIDVLALHVPPGQQDACEAFIRTLMAEEAARLPVVALCRDALESRRMIRAGAVDAMLTPGPGDPASDLSGKFIRELSVKLKLAGTVKLKRWMAKSAQKDEAARPARPVPLPAAAVQEAGIIAIGASTGGTEAIFAILKALPPNTPAIVVVQHMPPGFTRMYAQRLDNDTALHVSEARGSEVLVPGMVLIAPGDKHLRVIKRDGAYVAQVEAGERVSGHCPSVDVLFSSVALAAGADAVGIILTGMGRDGARGLKSMHERGAFTIGQDEASCIVYGMPKVAFEEGGVEQQAPLNEIPRILLSYLQRRK